MARFRPIDSKMWDSATIWRYNCVQLAIFMHYHTRRETTESGIQPIQSLDKESSRFKHFNGEVITADEMREAIAEMPENFELDEKNNLIFCVQFFQHNGMTRGRPEYIAMSIRRDMERWPYSNLWQRFITVYPTFHNLYTKVYDAYQSRFRDSNSNDQVSHTYGSRANPSERFAKVVSTFCNRYSESESGKGERDKEGGYIGGKEKRERKNKRGEPLSKVSDLLPAATSSSGDSPAQDLLAVGQELIKKSSFEHQTDAINAFTNDYPTVAAGSPSILPRQDFHRWLQKNHIPNPKAVTSSLLAVLPKDKAEKLASIMPALTVYQVDKKLVAFKGCSADTIFNAFVHGIDKPAENTIPDHPLLKKAANGGLDKSEFKSLPFMLRDMVEFNPEKELYFLKK